MDVLVQGECAFYCYCKIVSIFVSMIFCRFARVMESVTHKTVQIKGFLDALSTLANATLSFFT